MGITVQYCAEEFDNNGSPVSTIVKGVKRAMAGEYSRELSTKVFAGQGRLIELGFRQGRAPGFGLRCCLIDHGATVKGRLARGEHKSIQTDRMIIVPGPEEEIEIVRWIYRSFTIDGKSEREIAIELNERRIPTDLGRPWTRASVHQVLINEKYIGNTVWNRGSFKLKKKHVRNIPDTWLRANGVFEPIVDHAVFEATQAAIRERSIRLSNDELFEILRRLLQRNGYLSGLIIDEADATPSSGAYQSRFGSLLRAYQLVGFTPDRDYRYIEINRERRRIHPEVVAEVVAGIEQAGGAVEQDQRRTCSRSMASSRRRLLLFAARKARPDRCAGTFGLILAYSLAMQKKLDQENNNASCPPDDPDNDDFNDPPVSPLIIDLDGDGVHTTNLFGSRTFFDLDGDGLAEHTAWASPSDGFLALDRNNNGRIDNISELFGNRTRDGFFVLRELDSNNDGIISVADNAYSQLKAWRDANSDGQSEESELLSLGDAHIASISLQATAVNQTQSQVGS